MSSALVPKILTSVKTISSKQGKIATLINWIKTKVGSIFEVLFGTSSLLIKIAFIFQTFMGLLSAILSAILLFSNLGMIKNLITGVTDDSDVFLDKIVQMFSQYPDFNTLIAQMDSNMTSLSSSYFTPPVTFTSILNTFGIGEAFNTILTCALQGVAFVISIRILMWSLSRLKLTVTRPLG